MAYVAISQQLREDVSRTIRAKMNVEQSMLTKPSNPILQPDDPRLIQKFWGEHAKLRELIPQSWCVKIDNLQLSATYEEFPGDSASTRTLNVSASIMGGYHYAPPKAETYYPKLHVTCDDPDVIEHIEYEKAFRAITLKWNKISTDVNQFLLNAKSLNEALKLWPDLRIYIPQNYIDRLGVKHEKQAKAESRAMEILKQIDTDAAVASAVTLRIMQATIEQEPKF